MTGAGACSYCAEWCQPLRRQVSTTNHERLLTNKTWCSTVPADLVSGGSALSSALSCHPCQVCEAKWWWHGNLWSRASGSWRRSDGRASPSVPRLDAASRRPLQTLISSTCRRCKHVPMDTCSKISGMSVTRPDSPQVRAPGRYQARQHQGHRKGKEQNEVKI